MRYRIVWAMCLAVSLGWCAARPALADEPAASDGNWFTRLFYHGTPRGYRRGEEKIEPDRTVSDKTVPAALATVARAPAKADYLRRVEVCDALRDIAFQLGDTQLMQKANQLEDRAWDAYIQRANREGSGAMALGQEARK